MRQFILKGPSVPKRREKEKLIPRHIITKYKIFKTIENVKSYRKRLVVFFHLMFLLKFFLMSKY